MKLRGKFNFALFTLLLCMGALLSGCGGEKMPPTEDRYVIPAFEWKIVSEKEMVAIYESRGMELTEKDKLEGFVELGPKGYTVYTKRPLYVDDNVTKTLGHEVLHIALGPDYHKSHQ